MRVKFPRYRKRFEPAESRHRKIRQDNLRPELIEFTAVIFGNLNAPRFDREVCVFNLVSASSASIALSSTIKTLSGSFMNYAYDLCLNLWISSASGRRTMISFHPTSDEKLS